MKNLITIASVLLFTACTSTNDFNKGKAQLEGMGYTDVRNTGHEFFWEDDKFSTGFKAKDRDGNTVTGCFCSGYLKGMTIRFE